MTDHDIDAAIAACHGTDHDDGPTGAPACIAAEPHKPTTNTASDEIVIEAIEAFCRLAKDIRRQPTHLGSIA